MLKGLHIVFEGTDDTGDLLVTPLYSGKEGCSRLDGLVDVKG